MNFKFNPAPENAPTPAELIQKDNDGLILVDHSGKVIYFISIFKNYDYVDNKTNLNIL